MSATPGPNATALLQSLAADNPDDVSHDRFAAALDRELRSRADAFLAGIERYRRHPYRRDVAEPPALWQEGTTRLLDYGAAGDPAVLVVPSLINRAYVLDLLPGKSLLRYLAACGLRPLLVDWGAPAALERGFTLTDYIAGRLEAAAAVAVDVAGDGLGVLGYCMGGLLALGLAERRPDLVRALALLATPWSFHAEAAARARLLGTLAEPFALGFAALGEVPVDVLQGLFAALDPLLAMRKFIRFAGLPEGSAAERDFVAVEDWLNDGVALALPVARECLGGWYGSDTPGRGLWRVAGRAVLPQRVAQPSLVVVPALDRIVPPATAAALLELLPAAQALTPGFGHIGMVVGGKAQREVWPALADWLRRHLPPRERARRKGSQRPRRALSI